jgi:hypothetical protein
MRRGERCEGSGRSRDWGAGRGARVLKSRTTDRGVLQCGEPWGKGRLGVAAFRQCEKSPTP